MSDSGLHDFASETMAFMPASQSPRVSLTAAATQAVFGGAAMLGLSVETNARGSIALDAEINNDTLPPDPLQAAAVMQGLPRGAAESAQRGVRGAAAPAAAARAPAPFAETSRVRAFSVSSQDIVEAADLVALAGNWRLLSFGGTRDPGADAHAAAFVCDVLRRAGKDALIEKIASIEDATAASANMVSLPPLRAQESLDFDDVYDSWKKAAAGKCDHGASTALDQNAGGDYVNEAYEGNDMEANARVPVASTKSGSGGWVQARDPERIAAAVAVATATSASASASASALAMASASNATANVAAAAPMRGSRGALSPTLQKAIGAVSMRRHRNGLISRRTSLAAPAWDEDAPLEPMTPSALVPAPPTRHRLANEVRPATPDLPSHQKRPRPPTSTHAAAASVEKESQWGGESHSGTAREARAEEPPPTSHMQHSPAHAAPQAEALVFPVGSAHVAVTSSPKLSVPSPMRMPVALSPQIVAPSAVVRKSGAAAKKVKFSGPPPPPPPLKQLYRDPALSENLTSKIVVAESANGRENNASVAASSVAPSASTAATRTQPRISAFFSKDPSHK